jgi:hypothetical protein
MANIQSGLSLTPRQEIKRGSYPTGTGGSFPRVKWLRHEIDHSSLFISKFVYADITLETVTLSTPNNVAVFITDAPANVYQ